MNKLSEKLFNDTLEAILPMVNGDMEKANLVLLNSMKSFVPVEEREDYSIDKPVTPVWCLNEGCGQHFFTLTEYKKKEVTCPYCNKKIGIRCYKNGSVNVNVIEENKRKSGRK